MENSYLVHRLINHLFTICFRAERGSPAGLVLEQQVWVRHGKLAPQVETKKVRARMPACRSMGWSFCPFVIEATGACGGKARHLMQLVTHKHALRHQCSLKETGTLCRTRLHLSLLRSLSRQLERGFPAGVECDAVESGDLFWF